MGSPFSYPAFSIDPEKSRYENLTVGLALFLSIFQGLLKLNLKKLFAILISYFFNYSSSFSVLSIILIKVFFRVPNRVPQLVASVFNWPQLKTLGTEMGHSIGWLSKLTNRVRKIREHTIFPAGFTVKVKAIQ